MNIDQFFNFDYNWGDLIFLTVALVLVYVLLFFLRKIIHSLSFLGRLRSLAKRSIDVIFVFYEPICVLILISVFVMIKPAFHGLLVGAIGVLGFSHWRNYFHGRLFMTDRSLQSGRRIRITDHEGIIIKMGRLGIQVRSDDGLHYMPYHTLVSEGFVLSSGDKIGGYYHLNVSKDEEKMDVSIIEKLTNILISSPYVDGDHKPEIKRSIISENIVEVKLLVKEENHLFDLMTLLEEYGFQSRTTKTS